MNKKGVMSGVAMFIVTLVGILVWSLMYSIVGIGATQGNHFGYVTAVENNDNIWWDANLVYFKTDAESTQEDIYCVNDPIVKSQLELYANSKERVKLEYSNPFIFWRSECNGGSSVVRSVDKSNSNSNIN